MDFKEAMRYLDAPNFMNPNPGLTNIAALLEELGNPQDTLHYVHIAGTNGKGSTAAFTERILRESGFRTGLYTSPSIFRLTERIRVNGREIPQRDLARLADEVKKAEKRVQIEMGLFPTAFERVTALAFLYFAEQKCDMIILETGLGGRLDATNIIRQADVSAITAIGLDHTEILGGTKEKIAWEKAGIIKQGGMTVLYEQEECVMETVAAVCAERNAKLKVAPASQAQFQGIDENGQIFSWGHYKALRTNMVGVYQMRNAVVALCIAEALKEQGWWITEETMRRGLQKACWTGRLEICSREPLLLVDAAHNPQGVSALAESLCILFPKMEIGFIVGVLADKEYEKMIDTVLPLAGVFFTVTPHSPRALSGKELELLIKEKGVAAKACDSVDKALSAAKEWACQKEERILCAFGSLYYIGDVISCVRPEEGGRWDEYAKGDNREVYKNRKG